MMHEQFVSQFGIDKKMVLFKAGIIPSRFYNTAIEISGTPETH
jgi:hypothetical protein